LCQSSPKARFRRLVNSHTRIGRHILYVARDRMDRSRRSVNQARGEVSAQAGQSKEIQKLQGFQVARGTVKDIAALHGRDSHDLHRRGISVRTFWTGCPYRSKRYSTQRIDIPPRSPRIARHHTVYVYMAHEKAGFESFFKVHSGFARKIYRCVAHWFKRPPCAVLGENKPFQDSETKPRNRHSF
jgi:hypothetical protein